MKLMNLIFLITFLGIVNYSTLWGQCGSTVTATIASSTSVSCYGDATGTATATATGGNGGPYVFQWDVATGSETSATATGLAAGTYFVTVTDPSGPCQDITSVTINQPPTAISVSAMQNNPVSCHGAADGEASASAFGGTVSTGYTYVWSTSQTSATATGLAAGVYGITAADDNGCTDAATITITEPTAVTATIVSQVNVACYGDATGEATVACSGGTGFCTFQWDAAAGGATTATLTGLSAGIYFVTVTDANGCTDVAAATIIEPSSPLGITVDSIPPSSVGGTDGQATAMSTGGTGSHYYNWSNGQTTQTATGLSAGNYTVTVMDDNGCTTAGSTTVTDPVLSLYITITTGIDCYGNATGALTAMATGGTPNYTYSWDGVVSSTSGVASGLSAGMYSCTATDAVGATVVESIILSEPNIMTLNAAADNSVSCNNGANGQATATTTGGVVVTDYTYLWDNGQTTAVATGLTAGTHGVTATDYNGCSVTASVVVTQPNAISLTMDSTNISCNGGTNGTATVTASGGTVAANYTYLWSDLNATTTANVGGLTAGVYNVTVTDDLGCYEIGTVSLTDPTQLSIFASITSNYNGAAISCHGAADGQATALATGGMVSGNYTYMWSPSGQTGATIFGLAAGNYGVTATDDNGCSAATSVIVTEPNLITVSFASQTNVTCQGDSTGTATVSASGGVHSYTYLWNASTGFQPTATATALVTGSYEVTAVDLNGCEAIGTVAISALNDAYINQPILLGSNNPQIHTGDSYYIDGVALDSANTTYAWTPTAGLSCTNCLNPVASPTVTTTYYLTATHSMASCVFQDSITIEVYPNDPTDTIYIGVEPDSVVNGCVTLPSFISGTQGTFGHIGASLLGSVFTPVYGCYEYTAGSIPNVVDTLVLVACERLCDTTIVIVTTGTCVWAGDANDDNITNNVDLLPIGLHHGTTGYTRPAASLNYTCQPSQDWGQGITGQLGTDIKHVDTDGNGLINDDDTLAISQNWGQIHLRGGHGFVAGPPMFVDTVVANPGDILQLPIMLGDLTNVVSNGYGLAFTINYDSTNIKTGSVHLGFDNSWMGNGSNTISIQKDFHALGKVEAALTRTNQTAITGSGQIGTLYLTIKDVVLPNRNWGGAVRLDFEVTNVMLIDNLGNLLPVDPKLTQVLVLDPATGTLTLEQATADITVRPNPASAQLTINTDHSLIERVEVYTLEGRLVKESIGNSEQLYLDVEDLNNGLYILSVQTEKGVHTKQLIIQK